MTGRKILIATAIIVSAVAGVILGITGVMLVIAGMFAIGCIMTETPLFASTFVLSVVLPDLALLGGFGLAFAGGVLCIPLCRVVSGFVNERENKARIKAEERKIEARINTEAFKQFIAEYFPEKGDFSLDDKMIKDRDLHKIYKDQYSPLLRSFHNFPPNFYKN